MIFFESVNDELVLTKYSSAPLIRYNIHDNGGLFNSGNIETQLVLQGLTGSAIKQLKKHHNNLPLVYLYGRDKFMVKIYGANIYSEHVAQALNHHSLQPILTGRFILATGDYRNNNPVMICRIELRSGVKQANSLINKIEELFVNEVAGLNSEYKFVLNKIGSKVRPKIKIYQYGHPKYFPSGIIIKNN